MCNSSENKPNGGPVLCDGAKELIVRAVVEGLRNGEIRARLKREKHYYTLSDNAFTRYRNSPVLREARMDALVNIRDVGIISLARRLERLDDALELLYSRLMATEDNTQTATLFRALIVGYREVSRLVDGYDFDSEEDALKKAEDAEPRYTIEQVIAGMSALTDAKKRAEAEAASAENSAFSEAAA